MITLLRTFKQLIKSLLAHNPDLFLRDALGIIHLGAYQAPNLAPDAETLVNNVSSTYNVLRGAADMGVKKVVLASSTAAFGFIYAKKLWAPDYLPLDEKHPSKPQDSYGLSKVLGESIADSIVAVRKDMTVGSLRFPGVNFDLSYESFRDRWRNPRTRISAGQAWFKLWRLGGDADAAAAARERARVHLQEALRIDDLRPDYEVVRLRPNERGPAEDMLRQLE